MLRKLLKYDFKTLLHTLLPIYGISLILSVISNIFMRITDLTPVFRVPMVFITGLSLVVSIGVLFISSIVGFICFYRQTVKDEGYLLHTLPVNKDSIIISKLLSLTVMELLSLVVAVISIIITINVDPLKVIDGIKVLFEAFTNYKLSAVLFGLAVLFGQINNILLIYVSISFGQKHSTNKLLYSIIYGVVIYNITQVITSLVYLPILLNSEYINALNETIPESYILNILLLISIFTTIVISFVYYILTKKNLENKLNLE